ncbi:E2 protein [Human papillomavirus 159]|uniref:Regulatory protein E2 n=1 Tax=Human papillomavirus 159 TaxID=1209820 RepID=I7LHY3_9PAPI|nr:E2 protein [Human papillomavirus 159]
METLSDRFNALQETLMELYEAGREDLQSQITHWQTLRQEQVLLYFARKHGVMRLGYQPVPPLATSESKAKDAIGMVLMLQSLQKSPFGQEPWTLVQTSLETVRSPPANCFKKGPQNIEVLLDGDPENIMSYTVWKFIYYQTVTDTWEKVEGHVDYFGAYHFEGTVKTYYINFETDAARYSKTGKWEVHVNKDIVFAPVTSSSPPSGDGGEASINTVSGSRSPTRTRPTSPLPSDQRPLTTAPRRYTRKASSPTSTRKKRQREREREKASTRRSRSTSRGRTQTKRGGRRRRGRSFSSDSISSTDGRRGRGGGGGPTTRSQSRSQSRSRSRSRSHSQSRGATSTGGVSPSEVGTGVRSVGRGHHGRLERLLAEAKDPPVMLLRGDANVLKCYRYRARKKHRGLVKYYSTTWSWVGEDSCDRVGRARMLLAFSTSKHRQQFINTMKLPPNVDWSLGSLDDY